MVFDVQLSSASNLPVIVNYSTSDGSAKSPGNYQSVTGTLNFTPGVTRMSISVPIVGTSVASPALTFKLQLANPVNSIIGNTSATGTILAVIAPPIASPVKFTVKDKWASGFVSEVGLSNTTTQPWSSWTLEFDLAANITNIWNGQILSHIGNRYIVKNLAYNGTVAKGGSTNFGFQASATTVPGGLTNVILNGKSI
jgi:chitinase